MTGARQIAVIGAGLMGHGIALALADAGHEVRVTDPSSDARDSARTGLPKATCSWGRAATKSKERSAGSKSARLSRNGCGCGVCVRGGTGTARTETGAFRRDRDARPVRCNPGIEYFGHPDFQHHGARFGRHRALGTHWWNPPHMLPLVEIVKTRWTSSNAVDSMFALLESSGKSPVMVERDLPGFHREPAAARALARIHCPRRKGICTAEAIDTVVKGSFGRRLAVLGPMENADLVGIELTQAIHRATAFRSRTGPKVRRRACNRSSTRANRDGRRGRVQEVGRRGPGRDQAPDSGASQETGCHTQANIDPTQRRNDHETSIDATPGSRRNRPLPSPRRHCLHPAGRMLPTRRFAWVMSARVPDPWPDSPKPTNSC